jgi:hypothetical protein
MNKNIAGAKTRNRVELRLVIRLTLFKEKLTHPPHLEILLMGLCRPGKVLQTDLAENSKRAANRETHEHLSDKRTSMSGTHHIKNHKDLSAL